MPVGCFLKNIIYGLHTVNSKGAIWGRRQLILSERKEKARNFLGQNRSFHSQRHKLYPTTCTIQQRLDTPGSSSLCDKGETRHKNKISFLHRLRKNLYKH